MLLTADTGNTHTVLGVFEEDRLVSHWRLATRQDATSDEIGALWRSVLHEAGTDARRIDGMVVCSVVPALDAVLAQTGERYFGVKPLFVGPGVRTGIPILYENPHEVGADRIVNAVAAVHRYGAPAIVLDFGTATTFDVVSEKGEYLGGIIAPGLGISADALFTRAARLPKVELKRPERVIGRNTEESIQAGLFHGYISLVEGIMRRLFEELGTEPPVVATGGLASSLAGELGFVTAVDPTLTLEGLRHVWEKNRR